MPSQARLGVSRSYRQPVPKHALRASAPASRITSVEIRENRAGLVFDGLDKIRHALLGFGMGSVDLSDAEFRRVQERHDSMDRVLGMPRPLLGRDSVLEFVDGRILRAAQTAFRRGEPLWYEIFGNERVEPFRDTEIILERIAAAFLPSQDQGKDWFRLRIEPRGDFERIAEKRLAALLNKTLALPSIQLICWAEQDDDQFAFRPGDLLDRLQPFMQIHTEGRVTGRRILDLLHREYSPHRIAGFEVTLLNPTLEGEKEWGRCKLVFSGATLGENDDYRLWWDRDSRDPDVWRAERRLFYRERTPFDPNLDPKGTVHAGFVFRFSPLQLESQSEIYNPFPWFRERQDIQPLREIIQCMQATLQPRTGR